MLPMLRHCIFGVQIYVSDELTSFTVEAQNGDLHLTKYPSRTGRWKMINLKLTERDGLSRERARERASAWRYSEGLMHINRSARGSDVDTSRASA